MTPLRHHIRATAQLAVPLIGSHLAQQAIGVADTVMTGWYGVDALAAVTLGATCFFIVWIVGSGFAMAVMPLVATAAADGDDRQVRRITRMGLWAALIMAIASYPLFFLSAPLLIALGQAPEIAEVAQGYLRIAGLGMAFSLMVTVLKSHLAALERTRMILLATVAAAVLNAALNWVLIFGNLGAPELGVTGAAIASLSTNVAMFAILALHAARGPDLALFERLWRLDRPAFRQVFRLGWPIGLTQLAESGLFTASTLMMGWIGTASLAAHGVAIQITSVMFTMQVALSSAATVRAGQAVGRGDRVALRQGAWAALVLSGVLVALTVALFLGMPRQMVGWFLAPDEPERAAILALGAGFLMVGALFQLVDAVQVVALGLLRGLQDTRVPMIHAVVSYWGLGAPAAYVLAFPLGLGGEGIWLGLALGLGLAAILMMTRFWRRAGAPAQAPQGEPSPTRVATDKTDGR